MSNNIQELIILYETDDILAVDKDSRIPVHGGKGIEEGSTLLFQVKRYLEQKNGKIPEFITPVHRIDMNTRGPVLFAKNRDSQKLLVNAFRNGEVSKTYHTLASGNIPGNLFIQADIVKGSHKKSAVKNIEMKEIAPEKEHWLSDKYNNSKTISATFIRPLEHFEDSTLCEVEIWTGRYHQIRAVFEKIGHPVCGDMKYNKMKTDDFIGRKKNPYPDGMMLVCRKLEIKSLGISITSTFDIKKPAF
jgi:23S rRNA-/tRNA-specific pseudouridylate synthase